MSALLVDPRFTDPDLVAVGDWHPARYTPSLSGDEHFPSDADRLLAVVEQHWRAPGMVRLLLDPWQVWLLRHLLELYPDDWPVVELRGQLRYRQAVVSVARQNGKSVLGALLAFYFLTMHARGPRVVGLASKASQARIVYDRVKYAVDNNPVLGLELKATASRGIKLRNGQGLYQLLPARDDAAEGEPITGAIYDELHLGMAALWDAIVLGQRAQRHSMIVGITTAGDADSDLLIRLYAEGEEAIAGADERFGFFVWEAPTDELTEAGLVAASPAIACGRVPLAQALSDARKLDKAPKDKDGVTGRDRRIRYVNNRFLEGSARAWASITGWRACAGLEAAELEHGPGVVFALERTEAWEWLTVTATSRRPDGRLFTEVVATLPDVGHDTAVRVCLELAKATPGAAFAVDRTTLAELGKALREHGLEVWLLTAGEMAAAAAGARATIARRALVHPGDAILNVQMTQARRRDLGDSWRLSRSQSTGHIDAVLATIIGLHVAATRPVHVRQLF